MARLRSQALAKLTKRTADAAAAEAERYILWDTALKGFSLRVESSGTKTFLVRYRVAGGKRFLARGRFGELAPEQARSLIFNGTIGRHGERKSLDQTYPPLKCSTPVLSYTPSSPHRSRTSNTSRSAPR